MESMNRRSFIRLMSAAGMASGLHPRNLSGDERPNILVITSDQHHPRMTGYLGHPHVKTPISMRWLRMGRCSNALTAPALCVRPAGHVSSPGSMCIGIGLG